MPTSYHPELGLHPATARLLALPPRPEQGTAGWLQQREGMLTASDIPAALGENPYQSPAALIRRKLGLDPPFEGNFLTRWGCSPSCRIVNSRMFSPNVCGDAHRRTEAEVPVGDLLVRGRDRHLPPRVVRPAEEVAGDTPGDGLERRRGASPGGYTRLRRSVRWLGLFHDLESAARAALDHMRARGDPRQRRIPSPGALCRRPRRGMGRWSGHMPLSPGARRRRRRQQQQRRQREREAAEEDGAGAVQ
eukprot:tig00000681_g3127.t1